MKTNKKFEAWFEKYGLMDDLPAVTTPRDIATAKRIAWRAYRRGIHDNKRTIQKYIMPGDYHI